MPMPMPSRTEALAEAVKVARQLAQAVKEEAMAGEHTPLFLLMQLSASVEQLAAAVLEIVTPKPAS